MVTYTQLTGLYSCLTYTLYVCTVTAHTWYMVWYGNLHTTYTSVQSHTNYTSVQLLTHNLHVRAVTHNLYTCTVTYTQLACLYSYLHVCMNTYTQLTCLYSHLHATYMSAWFLTHNLHVCAVTYNLHVCIATDTQLTHLCSFLHTTYTSVQSLTHNSPTTSTPNRALVPSNHGGLQILWPWGDLLLFCVSGAGKFTCLLFSEKALFCIPNLKLFVCRSNRQIVTNWLQGAVQLIPSSFLKTDPVFLAGFVGLFVPFSHCL